MRRLTSVLILILASLGGAGVRAAEPEPRAIANACAACHGTDGKSAGGIPTIAGMKAPEFVAKMQAFRSGTEDATVMDRIARGLSEAEIDGLAGYFAKLR